ncbi:MAG: 16S rRNA (uracil(1498)-N(3))-methyltransferase [Clostridia bacterium]|nr:16S rRNA (uracil(1498)-N(3))-methyltransferase [Clostridia bacterium]
MPKFFIKNEQINDNRIVISGEDVNHIANVLRMKIDDELQICDIDTSDNYVANISEIGKDKIMCSICKKIKSEAESDINLTIFQGIPKSDKMELIIQKSTELGVKEIIPVAMERCVSKISGKDEIKKIERWQKISEVAAKQSGRDIIPKIKNVVKIKEICELIKDFDMIIVPYEKAEDVSFKNAIEEIKALKKADLKIGIVIGPEGGFEPSEINLLQEVGAKIVTLGKRILRTETVALAMSSVIMYELGGSI